MGVVDLDRSATFYGDLGWVPVPTEDEGIVFYQMHGFVLGLFGRDALADDQNRPVRELGTGAMTLAVNMPDRQSVERAFRDAIDAGATSLKEPQEVFWGGYSGYYSDPDGHVWEVAHNPFWPLQEDGSLSLPESG